MCCGAAERGLRLFRGASFAGSVTDAFVVAFAGFVAARSFGDAVAGFVAGSCGDSFVASVAASFGGSVAGFCGGSFVGSIASSFGGVFGDTFTDASMCEMHGAAFGGSTCEFSISPALVYCGWGG